MIKKLLRFFVIQATVQMLATAVLTAQLPKTGENGKLLPVPKKIVSSGSQAISPDRLKAIYLDGLKERPALDKSFGALAPANSSGQGVITFRIDDNTATPSDEGYILEVATDRITVTAKKEAGLFYGAQTLSQLMEDAKDQRKKIPVCVITDHPDIHYRAIHLDLKHHLDSLSYYYSLIDRLADVKINAIIIEFEDKLKYKSAPAVAAPQALSIEDFAALSDYARKRNIEISPLIQGLGHASFILKHEQYKTLRDDTASDWSFDPLNPKTYELQFALYKDAIAATPHGKYLHIGGDEVGKLGMSELARKSGLKPIELQMMWLKKVCEYAGQQNRIPVFWDDMVFKLSGLYETTYDPSIPADTVAKRWAANESILNENIHLFPKNCVYMRWSYDNPELPGNQNAIAWYKKHELKVMAATSGQQIWPMLPRAYSNFQPVKEFAAITAKQQLEGILLTLWDDTSPHFETFWRGIYDYALFTWNYQDINRDEAHALFRHRFYGPALSDPYFAFQDSLELSAKFWETALIQKGDRENYPATIDTLDLPRHDQPGEWSRKHAQKLLEARNVLARYNGTRARIEKAMSLAKRNKYALEVFAQLNELQVYPAQLLLNLEKYDQATAAAKNSQKDIVLKYADGFSARRKNLEKVFSKSRILNNPASYIMDQNHHAHLANGTKNNDWMYVYELALNEKIKNQFAQ